MFRALSKLLLIVACLSLFAACAPKKVIAPVDPTPVTVTPMRPAETLADRAAAAWARGDMMESERLYGLALRDPATPQSLHSQAWERMATAAVSNGHIHSALEILEGWRVAVPGADQAPVWMQLWDQAADQLDRDDAVRRADALWRDPLRPGIVRFSAAKRSLASGDPALSATMTSAYEGSDTINRATMERELLSALAPLPETTLFMLVGPQPGPDTQFPRSVYLLESARRMAAAGGAAPSPEAPEESPLQALMTRLNAVTFADPALIGVVGGQMPVDESGFEAPEVSLPVPAIQELLADAVAFQPACGAMILPLSGPYGSIGSSIRTGAALAQSQMSKAGVSIDMHFIDTQNPAWIQQLVQLPAQCVAVGGPLQPDAYAAVQGSGAAAGRAMFTFMARLNQGTEGVDAWRFFPSRDDQLLTMLRFAQQLGISQFGIFHPDDGYGNAMAQEFSSLAGRMGGVVTSTMPYPVDEQGEWTKLAGSFVGVRVVNKVPIPSGSFQGVFLPDSWENMEMIVSTLFYQGEDSSVIMGTSLWEQALLENPPAMLNYMGLAVFPGMWNARSLAVPARLLHSGLSGRVDTWSALGYDFVRLVSAMHLEPGLSAQDVNVRLTQAQNMAWSMAPIRWQAGRAAQDLFVLSPAKNAPILVDAAVFKQRLDSARGRSERRAARALGKR